MNLVGILLAAGRGRRFDPSGERNKLLQRVLPAHPPVIPAHPPVVPAHPPVVPAQAGTHAERPLWRHMGPRLRGNDGGGDAELVVTASARTLLSVVPTVIAVVPPSDGGVADALRALGCDVTVCPDADTGMAASLVHAIRHSLPQADSWVVALADMPFVLPSTIAALRDALSAGADIAAPVMDGRRGNPVGFSGRHLPALLALQGDQGARGILRSHAVTEVEVNDPGIFRDVDTSADL